jgi:hypothetical protein
MSDRVYQEQEDYIRDCWALINEQKSEIARLRAALIGARNSLMATDQTNTAAYRWICKALEGKL